MEGNSGNENIDDEDQVDLKQDRVSDSTNMHTVKPNQVTKDSSEWPKVRTYIQYQEDDEWKEALVLSKQPKRQGKHNEWLNIHVTGEDLPRSIAWKEVIAWKPIAKSNEAVMILNSDEELAQEVIDAKLKEVENLQNHDVYEEVNSSRINSCVSTRWILTEKCVEGKKNIKARLVARGFEEDSTLMVKDSPTCTKESLRMVFTVATTEHWKIQSLDISSAFLQGNAIQRDVFVLPPKDIRKPGIVWKLKRCIYGLNDAPRAWYNKVKAEMIQSGAEVSKYDNSLFMWHNENDDLIGVLVTHVDDFTFAGTSAWETNVIGNLKNKFKISAYHKESFKYIGLSVEQTVDEIKLSQYGYVADMKPIEIKCDRKKNPNQLLNPDEKKELKSLAGQMLWVTNHTRPDMSFEACIMSNAGKHATVKHIIEANKAVAKLKRQNLSVKFCDIPKANDIEVICYTDATHASLDDGSSQGAYIIAIKGNMGLIPLSWQSRKLRRITKSPLASEASAECEGADAAYLIASTLEELYPKRGVNVTCKTDSKSLLDNLKTTKVNTDKRLRVDISRLKEMIVEKEIKVEWIPAKKQLADALTKRGASTELLVEALRMI